MKTMAGVSEHEGEGFTVLCRTPESGLCIYPGVTGKAQFLFRLFAMNLSVVCHSFHTCLSTWDLNSSAM